MSQVLFEDLEEGEIADDIVPEPEVQKKPKPLPRRYVVNDKKLKSRHRKKSCKHTERHKRKSSKSDSHSKHHKVCSKYNSLKHPKFPINPNLDKEEFIGIDSDNSESHYSHKKVPVLKSAFKNFRSPPRKVLNVDKSKFASHRKNINSSFPKSLKEHKKSPNKLKNISNFKDPSSSANEKKLGKSPNDKNENLMSKQKCENLPPIEVINVTDDEDEEELRRIALATCLKRSTTTIEISSEDSSSKINYSESEIPAAIESDNYEIVDMDVDNDSENMDKVGDLFVIDTTPTYFCELNERPPGSLFDPQSNVNQINDGIVNGFLPNINIEDAYQNLSNDVVFSQNINNDLYTNFEVDKSRLPSNHLDDEFEEELLRAELIANMKSMRQNNESIQKEDTIITRDSGLVDNFMNVVPKDTRVVKLKSDSCDNDKLINTDCSVHELGFRDDRTVSIIKDVVLKETPFITKSRTVSSVKPNLPNTNNSSIRKVADIKVKLNNVHSVAGSTPNIITLPQERIIISLNNETSSDESDQEDNLQAKQPEKNPAVASLEALISNARQESDGKKKSPSLNGASDALSCLSKAQQEEYNALIKILAKKKDPFMRHSQEIKKVTEDPNLILLKKKFKIATDNYEKEKALMNTMMKELVKKKRSYMLSKIKTQQLKEQLVAAEKVRKANLQVWTKCASELQTLKKSVNKRQALINSLQTKISSFFPETVSNGFSPTSNTTPGQEYLLR